MGARAAAAIVSTAAERTTTAAAPPAIIPTKAAAHSATARSNPAVAVTPIRPSRRGRATSWKAAATTHEERDEGRCGLNVQPEGACKVDGEGEQESPLQGGAQSDEHNGAPNLPEAQRRRNLQAGTGPTAGFGNRDQRKREAQKAEEHRRESDSSEPEAREERAESKPRDDPRARGGSESRDPVTALVFRVAIQDRRVTHGDVSGRTPIDDARQQDNRKRGGEGKEGEADNTTRQTEGQHRAPSNSVAEPAEQRRGYQLAEAEGCENRSDRDQWSTLPAEGERDERYDGRVAQCVHKDDHENRWEDGSLATHGWRPIPPTRLSPAGPSQWPWEPSIRSTWVRLVTHRCSPWERR